MVQKTAVTVLELLDKREEKRQFERWLKNRSYTAVDVNEFASDYLSHDDKLTIAIKAAVANHKASRIDKLQSEYGDQLAAYIESAIDEQTSQQEFAAGMRDVVYAGLLAIFKESAGVPEDENLNEEENSVFSNLLAEEMSRVNGFVSEIYAGVSEQRTARFDRVRERLQGLAGNLGGRLSLWANAARLVFNHGKMYGRKDVSMRWEIGATEEHCSDCLRYNGQVKSRDEWQNLAGVLIYPQSRTLECKGYNCDCRLVEV